MKKMLDWCAFSRVELDARLELDEHRSRARGGQTAIPRAGCAQARWR
jgi:hypothetical protein